MEDNTDEGALPGDAEMPSGRILDYISGRLVRPGNEELLAVQPFSRQLVEDYGYPKEHVQTRPQWRVKARPSDASKSYPVDIAVFSGSSHRDDDLYLVVECKRPDRRDGRTQLEDYMRMSHASLGVWFNGQERLFLRKLVGDGIISFSEVPNIPRYGQRIDDIGRFMRADLKATHNLKVIFSSIRNYLAANAVGMTRDEALAQQIMNLIFCKIYDERFTRSDTMMSFRAGIDEASEDVADRIRGLFEKVVRQYADVFEVSDKISLDDRSIAYVVGELQPYCLIECERDSVADAFEIFIGPSLKGSQGQFFTPRNVTALIRELVQPTITDVILDPACGSGGFLVEALRGLWAQIDQQAVDYGWPESECEAEKQKVAIRQLRGIDKDEFSSRVSKAYMALLGDGRGGIFCENSLAPPLTWSLKAQQEISFGKFDVIMTNPPFGSKLRIIENSILGQYDLGRKWTKKSNQTDYVRSSGSPDSQTPQVLFIERCLDLLKDDGRLGIVLPESMLCNPTHRYILRYILTRARIRAVISIHDNLFQPYTHAKTCVVLLEKGAPPAGEAYEIFMAVARWCGHDSRGHEIPFDDVPKITERWKRYLSGEMLDFDHLGFVVSSAEITDSIYLPKYYNPEVRKSVQALSATHDLILLGDLVDGGVVRVDTGDEVGKLAYGTGLIPFIRTSDIANWQIKTDPKHGVSQAIYDSLSVKQNVETNDILMVRDGTYLVGTCAIVTDLDSRIVYQSHLLKFKVLEQEQLSPFLLLAALSNPIVKAQISAKRFTQDIIDTLGGRWRELVLPIPKVPNQKEQVIDNVRQAITLRMTASELAWTAIHGVAPNSDRIIDLDDVYDFTVLNN